MGVWELRTDGQAGPGHRRDADDLGQRYPGDERGFDGLYKARSRGFRNKERFANAIYFHLGVLNLYPEGVVG